MKKLLLAMVSIFLMIPTALAQSDLDKALSIGDKLRHSDSWECIFAKNRKDIFRYNCYIPLMFSDAMKGFNTKFSAKNTQKLGGLPADIFVKKINTKNGSCSQGKVVKGVDQNGEIICDFKNPATAQIELIEGKIIIQKNGEKKVEILINKEKAKKYPRINFYGKMTVENPTNKPAAIRFVQDNSVLRLEAKTKIRLNTDNRNKKETKQYTNISDVLVYNGIIWGRVLHPINIGNGEIMAGVRGTSILWEQRQKGNLPTINSTLGKPMDENTRITVFDSRSPINAINIYSGATEELAIPTTILPIRTQLRCNGTSCISSNLNMQNTSLITNQRYQNIYQTNTTEDVAYMNKRIEELKVKDTDTTTQQNTLKSELQSTEKSEICGKGKRFIPGMPVDGLVCVDEKELNDNGYIAYVVPKSISKYNGHRCIDGGNKIVECDNNNNNNNNKQEEISSYYKVIYITKESRAPRELEIIKTKEADYYIIEKVDSVKKVNEAELVPNLKVKLNELEGYRRYLFYNRTQQKIP